MNAALSRSGLASTLCLFLGLTVGGCKSEPKGKGGALSATARGSSSSVPVGGATTSTAASQAGELALPDGFLLPLPAGSKLLAVKSGAGRHLVTAWFPGTMANTEKFILAESKSLGLWATRVDDVGAEGETVVRAWPRRPVNPAKAKRATIDVRLSPQRKGIRARIDASDIAPASAEGIEETGNAETRCEAYCKKEIICNADKANILDCDMECTPQGTLRAMTAVWDCTDQPCKSFNACTEKALAESLGIDDAPNEGAPKGNAPEDKAPNDE